MAPKLPKSLPIDLPTLPPAVVAKIPPAVITAAPLAKGAIGANILALFILLILFLWTAASKVFELQAKDDKDARWWDFHLMFYEETTLKIVEDLIFLIITGGMLFSPMKKLWHPNKGLYDRFNLGVLAGNMFMYGNMLLISFWYSVNFGEPEQDYGKNYNKNNNKNNNKNYDNNDYEEEEEEGFNLMLHHRAVTAALSFLLAAVFCTLSYRLYREGRKLRERGHGVREQDEDRVKGMAHMELITEIWKLLSYSTISIFIIIYTCTCILLGGQEMANLREEGLLFNLISVLGWVMVVTVAMIVAGRRILGQKKADGTLGVGLLSGGTMGYSLLMLMVCVLYANPALKEHKNNQDGAAPAIATSFACFFFFLLYLAFSLGMYKYQSSIIGAALEGQDLDTASDVEMGESAGDFKRMEDEPEVKADDSTAGDFQRMEDKPEDDNSTTGSSIEGYSPKPENSNTEDFKIVDNEDLESSAGDSKPGDDEPESLKDDKSESSKDDDAPVIV